MDPSAASPDPRTATAACTSRGTRPHPPASPCSSPDGPSPAPAVRIAVGSENPVKVAAVAEAARAHLPGADVLGVAVASGVADQPVGDQETLRGARNRARAALATAPAATIGVGIESGVVEVEGRLYACSWVAACDVTGRTTSGCSARFPLPAAAEAAVRDGLELEEAMRLVSGRAGLGRAEGAVGYLTHGRVSRGDTIRQALHIALAPLRTSAADPGAPR